MRWHKTTITSLSVFEAPQLNSHAGLSMAQTGFTQADIRIPQLSRLGSLLISEDRSRSTNGNNPPRTTSPLPTDSFSFPLRRPMSASDYQTQLQSPYFRPRSLTPRQQTIFSDSLTTPNATPNPLNKDAKTSADGNQYKR